jgi:hypothetical protein
VSFPSLPFVFNDNESSTKSFNSKSSEKSEAAVLKTKQVNEMSSSSAEDKLNKRQQTVLSNEEALALLKHCRHLDDFVLVDRRMSFSKAA